MYKFPQMLHYLSVGLLDSLILIMTSMSFLKLSNVFKRACRLVHVLMR